MPPDAMPPISKAGKREQEQNPEQLLIRLRREYDVLDRNMFENQKASIGKLQKSSRVVQIFQEEYVNIGKDLTVATAPGKIRQDSIQFSNLNNLVNAYSVYNDEVRTQKIYMKELEGQIKKVSRHVLVLRKEYAHKFAGREDFARGAKCVLDALENKLEVQMKKFNVIVAKNHDLRDHLRYILIDRRNFMGIWNRLIEKLATGKGVMLDLIEQATLAYDQREDWCTKLQLLRIEGYRDLLLNIDKMRGFKHKEDKAKKLQSFYTTKGQKRVMLDMIMKEKIKSTEIKRVLESKLANYKQMVNEIREFTHLTKTEAIVQAYTTQDVENFKLFEFVMEMIREAETNNEDLALLHVDIDERTAVNGRRGEQQMDTLSELEAALDEAAAAAEQSKEEVLRLDSHIHDVMAEIEKLFRLCRCDRDPLLKLLGRQATIHQFNVLLYLEILEKKIHEVLVTASYESVKHPRQKKFFSEEKHPKIYTIENIVQDHPCALCLQQETVSELPDAPVRALSRREAINKLKMRVRLPGGLAYIHRLSKCHMPGARHLLQQRYQ